MVFSAEKKQQHPFSLFLLVSEDPLRDSIVSQV